MIPLLLAAVSAAAAIGGCINAHPRVKPAKPAEYTVIVRADSAWQDSHIRVMNGQIIQCKADGQWNDHFSSYGPEGDADIVKKHFGVSAPANSLIMRISNETNCAFFVGRQTNVVATRSGNILFRKNYSLPIGMDGEMTVKVKVCPDTDGDGLADYDEINVWKTNPLHSDSDGDGFTDLEEISDRLKNSPEEN